MVGMTSPALQDIVALLGCPAAGNPAQYLFERAISAAGLDWRFLTFDVLPERLAHALGGVDAMGFRGCLLSGALQEQAMGEQATGQRATEDGATGVVAHASPAARFAGAVSLVEHQAGGLFGHMTDGRGIVEALRAHAELSAARVMIAGAGPTGRATALELALAGVAEILVTDRSPELATALVERLRGLDTSADITLLTAETPIEIPQRVGIVVVSRGREESPATFSGLRADLVLADTDLVEQPSVVVAAGQKAGCCVIDGLEVHVAKIAIDFQVLTGSEPDTDMLREALEEFLSG
jgi:shikimate dehydrogenase